MERLILARHGRTAANAGGLLVGHLDVPLDERGLEQAALVGKVLAGADRVISSPLQRCRHKAEAIGLPVEIDERWIELDYGEFDGRVLADVPADTWARWRRDSSFAPPGGESLDELAARVHDACEELAPAAATAVVDAGVSRIDIGATGPSVRLFNRGLSPGA